MTESLKEIAGHFWPYSTVLLRLSLDEGQQPRAQQIGSGTYVSAGDIHGILTAQHCARALEDHSLGLSSAREGVEHHLIVERSNLDVVEVGKWQTKEYGPDLALIILTKWDNVATIKATNSFFNLSHDREKMLAEPSPPKGSIWVLCGMPNERLLRAKSAVSFDHLLEFQLLCGATGVDRYFERDGFDYFEIDVDANGSLPSTFEGVSGGGLWQVPTKIAGDDSFVTGGHFLSGVAFWEGRYETGRRYLRGHGRLSIYSQLFQALGIP